MLSIVRIALLLAAISFGQETGSTSQQADRGVATVVQVIVTGSLIPTAEEVGPNPVFIINRDLINKSGAGTTTEQLLQRQPVMNWRNYSRSEQCNRPGRLQPEPARGGAARFGPWRDTGAD